MPKILVVLSLVVLVASCASRPAPPAAAVTDLAATGRIRAAINFGNPILATKDAAIGEARGVSVDLARELQQLEADARRLPGLRLLEGRFMVINQAMALPRGRAAGHEYLTESVAAMNSSGFVAQSLARHGIEGAAVAP